MKHTPGPWHVSTDGTIDGKESSFTVNGGGGVVALVNTVLQQGRADARLIASAPALLDALRDLVACTPETYDNRHELRAAIDAISQATGGAA